MHGFSLDNLMVAWDFSKSAARAVGDALPILRRARQIRAMVVRGELDIPQPDVATLKSPVASVNMTSKREPSGKPSSTMRRS